MFYTKRDPYKIREDLNSDDLFLFSSPIAGPYNVPIIFFVKSHTTGLSNLIHHATRPVLPIPCKGLHTLIQDLDITKTFGLMVRRKNELLRMQWPPGKIIMLCIIVCHIGHSPTTIAEECSVQ